MERVLSVPEVPELRGDRDDAGAWRMKERAALSLPTPWSRGCEEIAMTLELGE
jgi:hypothetical protein